MKCPNCNEEMELGIIKIDDPGIVSLVYQSAEDAEKKGLKQKRSVNPTIFFVNRNTKTKAYHCLVCRRVIAIFDEA